MSVRTAHVIAAGRYLPHKGGTRKVPSGSYGLWCELCEWTVLVSRRHGFQHADALRRQHLGTAHLSSLTNGSAVLDPELREPFTLAGEA